MIGSNAKWWFILFPVSRCDRRRVGVWSRSGWNRGANVKRLILTCVWKPLEKKSVCALLSDRKPSISLGSFIKYIGPHDDLMDRARRYPNVCQRAVDTSNWWRLRLQGPAQFVTSYRFQTSLMKSLNDSFMGRLDKNGTRYWQESTTITIISFSFSCVKRWTLTDKLFNYAVTRKRIFTGLLTVKID